jgi:hypothetical protein
MGVVPFHDEQAAKLSLALRPVLTLLASTFDEKAQTDH